MRRVVRLVSTLLGFALGGVARAACPEGTVEDGDGCRKAVTQIEFEGLGVQGELVGPGMQYVVERPSTAYPCDNLRKPGLLDQWETCLVNYYGNKEVDTVSFEVARRLVDSRSCPDDSKDIGILDEIVRAYARHPKQEDLSELRIAPLYPGDASVEPQLPLMCGYNKSQGRWYPPRNFYCDAGACYPQAASGAKNKVRYVPIPNGRGLMEVQSDDPDVRSVADGGGYGNLRVIPLGNRVWLVTSGGMYGDVYYYGLVIVPDEAQYLRRACELEGRATEARGLTRMGLRASSKRYLQQAFALVEWGRTSIAMAQAVSAEERIRAFQRAEELVGILGGSRSGPKVEAEACVLYESRYPRAYLRDQEAKQRRAAAASTGSTLQRVLGGG